jgi:hypothetical protein
MTMRKKSIRSNQLGSLRDEPGESARKILLACVPATMSFWIDDRSIIRAVSPGNIPSIVEPLIIGTYSIGGASLEYIVDDLVAARRERGKAWLDSTVAGLNKG